MNKNYKEVHGFLTIQQTKPKDEKIFVKCDDYKLNMFYNFRRKLIVEELLVNRFVQYGYAMRPGDGSFHEAVKLVMAIAQFFCIMPVCGILNSNVNRIKFKWFSIRTILTIILISLGCSELATVVLIFTTSNNTLGAFSAILFETISLSYFFIFFKLAREWPKIMRKWRQAEDSFLQRPYGKYKGYTLIRKIRTVGFIMIMLSVIEHVLYLVTALYKTYKHIIICDLDVEYFEHFFARERKHLSILVNYNFGWFLLSEWINLSLTFCWNYADIFISLISICLAHRFNQINQRLAEMEGKNPPEAFWMEIRSHYIVLIQLLEFIDNKLSFLIPISCFNDLFFICLQLFNSFNAIPYLINKIYFYGSMLFIIARSLMMLYCASSIYDITKIPLSYLRRVPLKTWNMELQRFYELVAYNTITLTGMNFFYLTKSVILVIMGTVVTYEIVLLDMADRNENIKPICG